MEQEALRQELEEAQQMATALKGLLSSRGWGILHEFAEAQIRDRRGGVLYSPLESINEIGKQQFALGEAAGLEMLSRWASAVVTGHEERIRELRKQLGDTKDDEVEENVRARDDYAV